MTEVFVGFLNRSIMASCMLVAVLLVRSVFRRMPRAVLCLLWCLVGLRLILPILPESPFSLMPNVTVGWSRSVEIMSEQPQENATIANDSAEAVSEPTISDGSGRAFTLWNEEDGKVTDLLSASPMVVDIVAIVWLVGVIVLLGYSMISYIHLKRRVLDAVCWRSAEENQVIRRKNIYQSERVSSPFVLGVFSPKIYVPYDLEQKERMHIIAHEQAHIRRGDHLVKPMSFLLLAVHWFNPLIWVWFALLCKDMELACDEWVMRGMNLEQRKTYAQTLLECSTGRRNILVYPLAFGEVGVAARIKNALHYKKPTIWVLVLSLVICIVVAVCFLTSPKKEIGEMVQINEENNVDREIMRDEDGYHTPDGLVHQYCHVLSGTFNNAVSECSLLVYTNKPKVTFQEAEKRLFSSSGSLLHYYAMYIVCCNYTDETKVLGEYNTLSNVSISLEDVSASGATMKLHNQTGVAVEFGSNYSLQGWKNEAWHELPVIFDNFGWNAILYSSQSDIYTKEVTWAHYGSLPQGKYRLVKTVQQGGKKYPLAVEFEIN